MKKIIIILLILASGLLWAQSGKKALIINYTYTGDRLRNDVGGLIAKLTLLSYEIVQPSPINPSAGSLQAQVSQWISKLTPGDTVFIYIHAFSEKANSKNSIVTSLGTPRDLYDLDELFQQLKKQKMQSTTTVVLDVMSRNGYLQDNPPMIGKVNTEGILTLYSHLPDQSYKNNPNSEITSVVTELTSAFGLGYASMEDLVENVAGKIKAETKSLKDQAQIPFVDGFNTLTMDIPTVPKRPTGLCNIIKSEPIGSGAVAATILGAIIYGSVRLLTPKEATLPDPPGAPH